MPAQDVTVKRNSQPVKIHLSVTRTHVKHKAAKTWTFSILEPTSSHIQTIRKDNLQTQKMNGRPNNAFKHSTALSIICTHCIHIFRMEKKTSHVGSTFLKSLPEKKLLMLAKGVSGRLNGKKNC